jgi:hypothetical protein
VLRSYRSGFLDRKYRRNARKSREWTKKWLLKRQEFSHINLLKELRFHPKDWHHFLRMNESTYLTLLSLVSPLIQKKSTTMRQAITPHERLTATLRFLATGRNYEDLKFFTIMSPQALGKIMPETCRAICKVLKEYYKVRVYNVKNIINNLLLWAICDTVLLKFAHSNNRFIIWK